MSGIIPFNKPFIAGKELYYIAQAVTYGNIAGDGFFTERCSQILQEQFGIQKVLMTPSCTAALEMSAMLCNLRPGDEAILPSFTFVSTANAIARLGARPVFVDIRPDTLNIDENLIEQAITENTKAIIPVHYAGVACEMDAILEIAKKYNLAVIEDAAQGVNAFYRERSLGSVGHLGCFSFHETKNYISGEGGALCLNSPELIERAEIIRDKGTNRKKFLRGEVDKYTWVEIGSSYVPSEITCAFLCGQLEIMEAISERRRKIDSVYGELLSPLAERGWLKLPHTPEHCRSNFHMYYILLPDSRTRDDAMEYLSQNGIHAVFHFVPLHTSPLGRKLGRISGELPVTESVSRRILRLPFYYEMTPNDQSFVVETLISFLAKRAHLTSEEDPSAFRKAA
jgi:dTDP-4-amino-4,6-dideoxygalactose transaminase